MKSAEDMLAAGKVFTDLSNEVDQELINTGFAPANSPPGTEPHLPTNVSSLPLERVKALYDEFLEFYNYISDRITVGSVPLGLTKDAASVVEAEVVLLAHSKKSEYPNADLRKAFVTSHPALLAAQKDHAFFKQLLGAQNNRLKKLSKSMDRLYRELMIRQPNNWSRDRGNRNNGYKQQQAQAPQRHQFRKVGS